MHIAVFSDYTFSSLGGIQTSVRAQCRELLSQGHQVTFVCPSSKEPVELDGLDVIEVPSAILIRGYEFVLPTKRIKHQLLNQLKNIHTIDIIHCHTNMGVGVLAISMAEALHVPLVQTFHGREDVIAEKNKNFPRFTSWFYSSLHALFLPHTGQVVNATSYISKKAWSIMRTHAEHADHITVPSNHFLRVFRDHGYSGSASVLPNGIDDSFVNMLAGLEVSPRIKPQIMWVGRLWPEKQPELFVETARLLPEYDFLMCGDGVLRKNIEQTKPQNLVLRTDFGQQEIVEAMKSATIFVHTSQQFDTQSMVLLEAAVTELPIIMLDEDLQETVSSPGSIVVEAYPSRIANEIQNLIKDDKKRQTMKRYLKSITPTIVQSQRTHEAIALYNKIIDESK